jgi:hypothetical protein
MPIAKTAFAIIFGLFTLITLFISGFPPAQLLREYLNIPQSTYSLWGIPLTNVLDGVANGLFWVLVGEIIYGLARYGRKAKPLLPLPVPPQLATPPLVNPVVDTRISRIPPAFTVNTPSSFRLKEERVQVVRSRPVSNRRKLLWKHEVVNVKGHPQDRYRNVKTGRFVRNLSSSSRKTQFGAMKPLCYCGCLKTTTYL